MTGLSDLFDEHAAQASMPTSEPVLQPLDGSGDAAGTSGLPQTSPPGSPGRHDLVATPPVAVETTVETTTTRDSSSPMEVDNSGVNASLATSTRQTASADQSTTNSVVPSLSGLSSSLTANSVPSSYPVQVSSSSHNATFQESSPLFPDSSPASSVEVPLLGSTESSSQVTVPSSDASSGLALSDGGNSTPAIAMTGMTVAGVEVSSSSTQVIPAASSLAEQTPTKTSLPPLPIASAPASPSVSNSFSVTNSSETQSALPSATSSAALSDSVPSSPLVLPLSTSVAGTPVVVPLQSTSTSVRPSGSRVPLSISPNSSLQPIFRLSAPAGTSSAARVASPLVQAVAPSWRPSRTTPPAATSVPTSTRQIIVSSGGTSRRVLTVQTSAPSGGPVWVPVTAPSPTAHLTDEQRTQILHGLLLACHREIRPSGGVEFFGDSNASVQNINVGAALYTVGTTLQATAKALVEKCVAQGQCISIQLVGFVADGMPWVAFLLWVASYPSNYRVCFKVEQLASLYSRHGLPVTADNEEAVVTAALRELLDTSGFPARCVVSVNCSMTPNSWSFYESVKGEEPLRLRCLVPGELRGIDFVSWTLPEMERVQELLEDLAVLCIRNDYLGRVMSGFGCKFANLPARESFLYWPFVAKAILVIRRHRHEMERLITTLHQDGDEHAVRTVEALTTPPIVTAGRFMWILSRVMAGAMQRIVEARDLGDVLSAVLSFINWVTGELTNGSRTTYSGILWKDLYDADGHPLELPVTSRPLRCLENEYLHLLKHSDAELIRRTRSCLADLRRRWLNYWVSLLRSDLACVVLTPFYRLDALHDGVTTLNAWLSAHLGETVDLQEELRAVITAAGSLEVLGRAWERGAIPMGSKLAGFCWIVVVATRYVSSVAVSCFVVDLLLVSAMTLWRCVATALSVPCSCSMWRVASSSSPLACPPGWTALHICAPMLKPSKGSGSTSPAGCLRTRDLCLLLTRVWTWWYARGVSGCCLLNWGGSGINVASTGANGVAWWAVVVSEPLASVMEPSRSCVRIHFPLPFCCWFIWRPFRTC